MRARIVVIAIVVLAAVGGSSAGTASTAVGPTLRSFDGCPSFLAYAKRQALPLVGPYGIGGGALGIGITVPPSAARDAVAGAKAAGEPEFSATNVQEEGVDEPDLVKTNGRTLFVASAGGVSAFDVRSPRVHPLSTVALDSGGTRELLLHGTRLIVFGQGAPTPIPI